MHYLVAQGLFRPLDVVVIVLNVAAMVGIGIYCARKTRSSEGYFLANRSMPGWVVGFSLMATIVSSMTFLSHPGATYKDDWRFMPAHVLVLLPAILAYFIFMPFFRQGHVRSAYEYLENRFGTWARMYGAFSFLMTHMFRTGVILYVVSIPFQQMSGLELRDVIIILGVLVAIYTIAGGLEAVIWTDLLQGIALIGGGLICIPIIAGLMPGGLGQIFSEAYEGGKFGVGSTKFTFSEKTVWAIILTYQFIFLRLLCTDQGTVQRYLAMKTDDSARRGFFLGIVLTVPVWLYFAFVGTALFVYYNNYPDEMIDGISPEGVFPHFTLTKVPAGLAGFVIAGLLAAAMSTLDSSINASAATVTNDFYRRFFRSPRSERHYLRFGRWASLFFSVLMIVVALVIDYYRTETLLEMQTIIYPIVGGGLVSLFLLGFFCTRVGNTAALIATFSTLFLIIAWVLLDTDAGRNALPHLANVLPDNFWIGIIPYAFLLIFGYSLSFIVSREPGKNLAGLTIWTKGQAKVKPE